MTLSKKHYVQIAKIIKANTKTVSFNNSPLKTEISTWLVEDLNRYFEYLNPNFKADNFRKACGEEYTLEDTINI
jgi:hypothetical protein